MPNIHDILTEIRNPQWVITTLSSLVAAFGAAPCRACARPCWRCWSRPATRWRRIG